VLVTELVRGAWLRYIRKYNAAALGSTSDLSEFLFGSERSDVTALRPVLRDIQHGQCFYCGTNIHNVGDLDHFVPWSRYPVDLGHNFVLADDRCNSAKGVMLAAEEYLARSREQSQRYSGDIQGACLGANIRADLGASIRIAQWAYGQAVAVGAMVWVAGREPRKINNQLLNTNNLNST
jgi:hypothetical protein